MSKPHRIPALESFVSATIGDGKGPNIYVVTDQGVTVTITRDYATARAHYMTLANRSPRVECALEARDYGVMGDVSPDSDEPGARLVRNDPPRQYP